MQRLTPSIGIGLRREIADETLALGEDQVGFLELAPENWMGLGGRFHDLLLQAIEKFPLTCHGLSLSLGSPEPLDKGFLKLLKAFFAEVPIQFYSEHLSFCKCGNAHLYDLLPLAFTKEAVAHVSERIKYVQDYFGMQIAIENISYYCPVPSEMGEAEFLSRVIEESGCSLLLDVNNVYVNAFNHKYDPYAFLESIPLDKVSYIHIAGHEKVADDLIIDTHAEPIIPPVYQLLEWVLERIKPVPILLERDDNLNLDEVMREVEQLRSICRCPI